MKPQISNQFGQWGREYTESAASALLLAKRAQCFNQGAVTAPAVCFIYFLCLCKESNKESTADFDAECFPC
jgi:hypothetical protein